MGSGLDDEAVMLRDLTGGPLLEFQLLPEFTVLSPPRADQPLPFCPVEELSSLLLAQLTELAPAELRTNQYDEPLVREYPLKLKDIRLGDPALPVTACVSEIRLLPGRPAELE
jgi:hypothetical protein